MTSLLLLGLVALCALPGAVVRGALGFAIGWVGGAATGLDETALVAAVAFTVYPFVVAVAAFADLGVARRRWMRRRRAGQPRPEEVARVESALHELRRRGAAMPSRWAVLGTHRSNAMVSGRTLLVGSDDVWSPHLAAILAHETGHLAGPVPDGRYVAAYNALVPRWLPKFVLAAVVLHGRRRELRADAYAHRLGFGDDLAAMMLEDGDTGGGRRWWWSLDRSHPTHARRVKRLQRLASRTLR